MASSEGVAFRWEAFNRWCDEYADRHQGMKPKVEDVRRWHRENAEKVWPDNSERPSVFLAVSHNKGRRVRGHKTCEYYKRYRAGKAAEQQLAARLQPAALSGRRILAVTAAARKLNVEYPRAPGKRSCHDSDGTAGDRDLQSLERSEKRHRMRSLGAAHAHGIGGNPDRGRSSARRSSSDGNLSDDPSWGSGDAVSDADEETGQDPFLPMELHGAGVPLRRAGGTGGGVARPQPHSGVHITVVRRDADGRTIQVQTQSGPGARNGYGLPQRGMYTAAGAAAGCQTGQINGAHEEGGPAGALLRGGHLRSHGFGCHPAGSGDDEGYEEGGDGLVAAGQAEQLCKRRPGQRRSSSRSEGMDADGPGADGDAEDSGGGPQRPRQRADGREQPSGWSWGGGHPGVAPSRCRAPRSCGSCQQPRVAPHFSGYVETPIGAMPVYNVGTRGSGGGGAGDSGRSGPAVRLRENGRQAGPRGGMVTVASAKDPLDLLAQAACEALASPRPDYEEKLLQPETVDVLRPGATDGEAEQADEIVGRPKEGGVCAPCQDSKCSLGSRAPNGTQAECTAGAGEQHAVLKLQQEQLEEQQLGMVGSADAGHPIRSDASEGLGPGLHSCPGAAAVATKAEDGQPVEQPQPVPWPQSSSQSPPHEPTRPSSDDGQEGAAAGLVPEPKRLQSQGVTLAPEQARVAAAATAVLALAPPPTVKPTPPSPVQSADEQPQQLPAQGEVRCSSCDAFGRNEGFVAANCAGAKEPVADQPAISALPTVPAAMAPLLQSFTLPTAVPPLVNVVLPPLALPCCLPVSTAPAGLPDCGYDCPANVVPGGPMDAAAVAAALLANQQQHSQQQLLPPLLPGMVDNRLSFPLGPVGLESKVPAVLPVVPDPTQLPVAPPAPHFLWQALAGGAAATCPAAAASMLAPPGLTAPPGGPLLADPASSLNNASYLNGGLLPMLQLLQMQMQATRQEAFPAAATVASADPATAALASHAATCSLPPSLLDVTGLVGGTAPPQHGLMAIARSLQQSR